MARRESRGALSLLERMRDGTEGLMGLTALMVVGGIFAKEQSWCVDIGRRVLHDLDKTTEDLGKTTLFRISETSGICRLPKKEMARGGEKVKAKL